MATTTNNSVLKEAKDANTLSKQDQKGVNAADLEKNKKEIAAYQYLKSFVRNRSLPTYDRFIFHKLLKNNAIQESNGWFDQYSNKSCWGCKDSNDNIIPFTKLYLDDNNYDPDKDGNILDGDKIRGKNRNTQMIMIRPFQTMGATAIIGNVMGGGNSCGFYIWETVDKDTKKPVDKDYGEDNVDLAEYWFECDSNYCLISCVKDGPRSADLNLMLLSDADHTAQGTKPPDETLVKQIKPDNMHHRTEEMLVDMFPTGFYIGITKPDKTKPQEIIRLKKPDNYDKTMTEYKERINKTPQEPLTPDEAKNFEKLRWANIVCTAKNSSGSKYSSTNKCSVYMESKPEDDTPKADEAINKVKAFGTDAIKKLFGSTIKDDVSEGEKLGDEAISGSETMFKKAKDIGEKELKVVEEKGGKLFKSVEKGASDLFSGNLFGSKNVSQKEVTAQMDNLIGVIDNRIDAITKKNSTAAQGGKKKRIKRKVKSNKNKGKKGKRGKKIRKTQKN